MLKCFGELMVLQSTCADVNSSPNKHKKYCKKTSICMSLFYKANTSVYSGQSWIIIQIKAEIRQLVNLYEKRTHVFLGKFFLNLK